MLFGTNTVLSAVLLVQVATAQLVGYGTQNGGVQGGAGGTTTTVTAAAAFKTAIAKGNSVVYLNAAINYTGQYPVASKTSIIGVGTNGVINGGGLKIDSKENVIVRNLKISKVKGNDGISVIKSTRVWIDHNEFVSDLNNGVDYYDGQLDITHACDYVEVSWNYFHDHYKSSLVGASCDNSAEDGGKFHLTYHHNYWQRIHTRTPALRFTHAHLFNNYFDSVVSQGIHSRCDAQVLVEANVFVNTTEPLSTYGLVIPDDSPNTSPNGDPEADGYANLGSANDWGSGKINLTHTGTFTSVPYTYTLTPLASVKSTVIAGAGVGKI